MSVTGLIPQCREYEKKEGTFPLDSGFILKADKLSFQQSGLLRQYLKELGLSPDETSSRIISLITEKESVYDEAGFSEEAYTIAVSRESIEIRGVTKEGLARGVQAFRQMLINADSTEIPCCRISDSPRFRWRGMHLDVSRHFFSAEQIKRFISHLALYRFNRLHLHLTDDQGWRIEIKKYPELTRTGAFRSHTLKGHYSKTPRKYEENRYGGFYTQEEMKDLVAYAREREIEIVPEIDMPGHMQAAIAAYPQLGCGFNTPSVRPLWGISQDILNAEESTVSFMQDVLEEILAVFPGKFIHIGGDEVPKYQWENSIRIQERMAELNLGDEEELQSWFIRRMDSFLTSEGRRTIGWDEILEGGLADNAAVMSWRGEEGGIKAAGMEHDVVMTPQSHTYFDHYQARPEEDEPLAIGGYSPLSKVYSYEPVPEELSPDKTERVLGSQGQLWTEYIPDLQQLEYMMFPRVCALAEVLWLPPEKKDYEDFLKRLSLHRRYFRESGINAHPGQE